MKNRIHYIYLVNVQPSQAHAHKCIALVIMSTLTASESAQLICFHIC